MGRGAAFNHPVVRRVPAAECARRLEQLLLGFKRQRKERESFNAWCRRIGDGAVARLLTDEESHPLADADDVPTPRVPAADEPVS